MGIHIGMVDAPCPIASGPVRRLAPHGRARVARVKHFTIDLDVECPDAAFVNQRSWMMASDLRELEQALQSYFDGLYQGDTNKLASVFHPDSHLFSVTDGKLDALPRERWFDMV